MGCRGSCVRITSPRPFSSRRSGTSYRLARPRPNDQAVPLLSANPPGDPNQPSATTPDDLSRLLVENVADFAIFALDPQGRVTSWNKGAQRLKGYTRDEIL